MRKSAIFMVMAILLVACDKHDPILPGVRDDIFTKTSLNILDTNVPDVPNSIDSADTADCPYTQKSDNTLWDGTRKIFAGFATNNSVAGDKVPVCRGNFVYAGLSTGELVKVNAKTRGIVWIADVYRASNMTGGASVLDIIAPAQIRGNYVYAGGLGDAFCKISDATGKTVWCINISVAKSFLVADKVAYVLDTDNNLNAVRLSDGAVYWRTNAEKNRTPKYQDKVISIGHERFDAETGKILE
jgi:outer membrane protein assembly factor BamB